MRGFDTSFGANAYEFKLVALPPNILPVANNDAVTTNEDTAVTINALGNDSDANGDILRIVQINGQAATAGSPITLASGALVTLNANGSLSFDPHGKYDALAQGATATASFTYAISDGRRGTTPALATDTVTVTGVNDAPTAITLSNSTVNENVVAAVIGTLTVADDTGDTHTFGLSDNRFEVVSGQLKLKLKPGISLDFEAEHSVSLNVTATDPRGLSKTQGFTITVNDVVENAAPTARADAVSVDEDATTGNLRATLLANDTDPDAGDTLSIASVDTAGTLGSVRFDAATQSLVYTADAGVFDLLAPGATAGDRFSYTVRDAGGLTSTASVAVTVKGGPSPTPVSLGNGADRGDGASEEDSISGGNGNDTLRGLGGPDTLAGDNGDDRLDGGPGPDTLTGGRGNDVFVLAVGSGRDTVTDFGQGDDSVAVDRALFADFAAVQAAARQEGGDVVIAAASGDAIVLQGVSVNSLGAADFSFF